MFWLMGIYYTAVLGFIFLAYSISYDEHVVFGEVVFLLVLLCAIPAVIFFNQKKKKKKDIESRSLCYTLGPCLSILDVVVCIC